MKLYLVMAKRKPNFPADVVGPHKDWLINLKIEGQLHMTGGFSDGSGGAYVLKNLDSLAQAQALVATDPLALRDASELTVYEWNTP
ncbi:MAG: YciI family protein [Pseudoxanthomonas sp.]